ncbi:hypothetical protein GW17_00040531 [Ensete ventricosum]|nr:hypothetical protein GW17_00040531 [Ensete ventricosum]
MLVPYHTEQSSVCRYGTKLRTLLQDAGCWTDAATLAATHLRGADYSSLRFHGATMVVRPRDPSTKQRTLQIQVYLNSMLIVADFLLRKKATTVWTMTTTVTVHRLSNLLPSLPVPSDATGALFLLPNSLRFSTSYHPGRSRRSPLLGLQKRTLTRVSAAGWFSGFGAKKSKGAALPEIVKAGDPVLHEPADEVPSREIGSEKIQKIIDDMVSAMRKAPGVGLAAPQIGVPLKVAPLFLTLLSSHDLSSAILANLRMYGLE